MNFAVGVFDLFAYSVPGSLYLGLLGYLALRFEVLTPAAVLGAPGVLLIIVVVLLSYLFGYLAYPFGALVDRVVPRGRRDAREEFLRRVPTARGRAYLDADTHLLLAGLQLHDIEASVEVSRLRASGLMLRNSAPPIGLAAITAMVEVFAGDRPGLAAALFGVLGVAAVVVIVQARKLARWAVMKTLELCYWLPDVDDRFRPGSAKP